MILGPNGVVLGPNGVVLGPNGVVLGIDQGTTGTRAVALDDGGRVVGRAYRAHAQHRPAEGWVEHDPEEILANLLACAREAAAGRPVRAIGLANQGETCLVWDAATLLPRSRAIVWQDGRTQAWMDALAADPAVARRVRETTGLRVDPYFSASKLRWLLDRAPAGGPLRAGTLDAWLLAKLTGVASTDVSTAARTLLYDVRALAWDPWLLELFGVPEEVLVPVRDSVADFGFAAELGAPITASLVDQPAAMVGEGCLAPGDGKATFGTGCFVYANTGAELRLADGLLATVAWRKQGRTTYALDGGILAAGTVIEWLRALGLGVADVADATDVVCVPALVGLGAPHWDRGARGCFLGLGAGTTRGELVRAALDGLACRVAEVLDAMGAGGAPLRADGGLTHVAPLMQAVADLAGVPVHVSGEAEATALGAALLAAEGAGVELRVPRGEPRVFTPRLRDADRTARRERFSRALSVVRSWR